MKSPFAFPHLLLPILFPGHPPWHHSAPSYLLPTSPTAQVLPLPVTFLPGLPDGVRAQYGGTVCTPLSVALHMYMFYCYCLHGFYDFDMMSEVKGALFDVCYSLIGGYFLKCLLTELGTFPMLD